MRRTSRLLALLLTLTLVVVSAITAPPAQAAVARITIAGIYYNSPGSDTGSNTSLNAEYIRIKNSSTTLSRNLTGWTIKDSAGHKFTFPPFTLGPGKSVYVHTGSGTNTASHLYWRKGWYVWNNDKDIAALRNASAVLAHTCAYNNASVASKVCS